MKDTTPPPVTDGKRRLALLLPAHNEELIIQHTIKSANLAGLDKSDIYVVDDNSSDSTRSKVLELLSVSNVLTVERSGKAGAIGKAIEYFDIKERYEWLHVADGDSMFGRDYFRHFQNELSSDYVVALGFVQSMPGNWISKYRVYQYTIGQMVYRRLQSWLDMITILPGPTTCFRTDILDEIDFETGALTEDFDITMQLHRKRLGKMKFIPQAINYTQDPRTIRDFKKQYLRWVRGFFQAARRHRIGLGGQRVDYYLGYQVVETIFNVIQLFVVYPLIVFLTRDGYMLGRLLAGDFVLFIILTLYAAVVSNRPNIIYGIPGFYILRTLETFWFVQAFVEIIILGRYNHKQVGWETGSRRYAVQQEVFQEVGL